MHPDAEKFGGRLLALRDAAGLSQQQLAAAADMSAWGVTLLTTGKRSPSWATVIALADALQCSTEAFRGDVDKKAKKWLGTGAELLGLRLRELRDAAGMSQQQLAVAAGLSVAGTAMLEQGKRIPTWATVVALADALHCSTEAFRAPGAGEKKGRGRPRTKKG